MIIYIYFSLVQFVDTVYWGAFQIYVLDMNHVLRRKLSSEFVLDKEDYGLYQVVHITCNHL